MQLLPDKFVKTNTDYIKELGNTCDSKRVAELIFSKILKQYIVIGCTYDEAVNRTECYLSNNKAQTQMLALLCANNWYHGGRQVYLFDDRLSEQLSRQNKDDMEVDVRALEQLPCDGFYVKRTYNGSDGFFTFYDHDTKTIIFTDLYQSGKIDTNIVQLADNMSIQAVLNQLLDNNLYVPKIAEELVEHLQFVLYLSAVNADIVPVTKKAIIKRRTTAPKTTPPPQKSELSEVGYRIGSKLQKHSTDIRYVYNKSDNKQHGTPKAPHLRRSHFHSFWTGSGENKKLVIKWLSPVFVNGGKDTDVSTVHKVE